MAAIARGLANSGNATARSLSRAKQGSRRAQEKYTAMYGQYISHPTAQFEMSFRAWRRRCK